jgi:hypothetical protein
LSRISPKTAKRIHTETVENPFAETRWPVYETYELVGEEGFRHIWAPHNPTAKRLRKEVNSIDPFSPEYADLFLTFARWFVTRKMDKGVEAEPGYGAALLDTARNGEAALEWVHEYGVLGLGTNPNSIHAVAGTMGSSSTQIAAEQLSVPHLGHGGTRAYRMSAVGGEHETIEMFVLEAYEANVVLRLYEAASGPTVNVPAIARYMSNRKPPDYGPPAGLPQTEKEVWSQDDEHARSWALAVVEGAVNKKVEKDYYPVLLGERGSYEEGWGFKSLLGAMWFQMRWFILGDRREGFCPRCGELFPKTRRDKVYCGDVCSGKVRAAKDYRRKKLRQQEAREATRRKLKR